MVVGVGIKVWQIGVRVGVSLGRIRVKGLVKLGLELSVRFL